MDFRQSSSRVVALFVLRALAVLASLGSGGCGSRSSPQAADAASPGGQADASGDAPGIEGEGDAAGDAANDAGDATAETGVADAGVLVACEGGAPFVAVFDDASGQVLRGGCDRFSAPTLSTSLCREDCLCSDLAACSDVGALDIVFSGAPGGCAALQSAGVYAIDHASWTTGGATESIASGWIRFDTTTPGARSGEYSVSFLEADGGAGDTLTGPFCVE